MTDKPAKFLACLVMFVAYLVILDAYVELPVLRSTIVPLLDMDFTGGVAFFFSGIVAYAASERGGHSNLVSDLMLPASVLVLFLLMATIVTSALLGLHTSLATLFSGDELAYVGQSNSLPLAEIIGFLLLASVGLNHMVGLGSVRMRQIGFGAVITLLHVVTLVGSATGTPVLSGEIPGISASTGALTAALFVTLGSAVVLASLPSRQSASPEPATA